MQRVKDIIHSIKNPESGKTLAEEGRIKQLMFEDGKLDLTYSRDGISVEAKRTIEDVIINELKNDVTEENITVKTVSTSSPAAEKKIQPQKQAQAEQANIKVGHGQALPNKKRIANVDKVIAISSGKGGVGKSTVSVNLAYALKNQGKKVGLIDADIYGPSIPMLLGQREAKPLSSENKKILPITANGLEFISFGLFIGEQDAVIWRGPMLGGVLNQFFFDVEWGDLDYLIIDLPPGTGDVQLSMVQTIEIDGVIGVSTPQDVALLDSGKGLSMFDKVNVPIVGMIENMSYFVPDDMPDKKYHIFGNGGVKAAAQKKDVPFLGEIPMEIALRESCDNGKPYMNNGDFEGRPVWKAYSEVAKKVLELTGAKKGIISKLLGK